ncbi:MAG: PAS domain S-box protein [Anaerolineae bacterium]|nr:PAS domain S-box protein [Anaerolineae bacterium]
MLSLLDFRVRQRDFLLEISKAITSRLDLNEVLKRVVNASVAMLAGQVGIIALRDDRGEYHIQAVLGVPKEQIPDLNTRLLEVIQTASARDSELVNTHLREMAAVIDKRLIQSFAIPLAFGGEAMGLMLVFRSFQGGATPDDIQVLQSFADQAAIAVHNAQLYERMNFDRKQLAAVIQHSADGVVILDDALTILNFNHAAERMTGWTAWEALGLKVDEVLTFAHVDKGDLHKALEKGWPYPDQQDADDALYVEGDLLRRDGLTTSVGIQYAPLFTDDGKLANVVANVRDISNFRQAQQMQNVFISTVSHELKTPVALIKGYAATLRREDVTWDEAFVREYSGVIEEESDRLTELIEDLLTASRIQAERGLTLMPGDMNIAEIARRSVARFQTQTDQHKFEIHFPADFPLVQGDETRFRQVVDNLVSNAIKYSPNGGTIAVGGTADGNTVSLYVRDQGVGMKESEMDQIFDRFYRVDGALSRKTQGTGLGLYLSKAIVQAHGGTIRVESSPGKGSTFFVTLPVS